MIQSQLGRQRYTLLTNRIMHLNLVTRKLPVPATHPYLSSSSVSSSASTSPSSFDSGRGSNLYLKGGSRSPEDVLRVTKEGLVKQRIQQFNRVPSLETLSQISEENCNVRRRTMGDVKLRQKITFSHLSVPHRSTVTRPHSSYITSTRIPKMGSAQDLRYFPTPSHSINRRSSVCSPDHTLPVTHTRVNRTDRLLKSRSYHESMSCLDLTPIRIHPTLQTTNTSPTSPTKPPAHKELVHTKSLPLIQSPSIILNIKKLSKSSDSSDKTPSVLLSPSPDSSDKFTKRYISSPPPSKRRTHIELSYCKPSFLLSPPPEHRLANYLDIPTVPESPTSTEDKLLGNSLDDSSVDDVFGSPDHSSIYLATLKTHPLNSSDPIPSTDSQGSEELGEKARDDINSSKSPVRKPSLLRRSRGLPNAERKKRTVTFTPEVLILQLCYEGKLKEIENIVKDSEFDSECINTLGPMGITAMHQCALDGNVECLQALVTAGGNVDVVDAEHCTPLHSAAINNHFSAIRFLLIAGADPTRVDDDNKTPYDIATVERVKKVLKMALQGSFISNSSSPSDNKEKDGFQFDYTTSELLEREDEVTSQPEPLHGDNSIDGSKGVSNIISNKRNSSTDEKSQQNREFMGIRLTSQKKEPLTQGIISEDDLSLTSSYSGYSGELSGLNSSCGNSDDSPCKSPMAFSTTALYSNTNSSVGTDLMERDNLAAYDIGSDLESDSEDFKFQEAVACQDNTAVCKILKENRERIDINRITRSDITALHHSVLEENEALTRTLVTEGRADVNFRDRDGWTPLHAASAVGNLKIAKFLVESGARTSLWNASGEFAVDVAEDDAMKRYLHSIMLGPHAIKKKFPTMLT